jgi:hypothetical protein
MTAMTCWAAALTVLLAAGLAVLWRHRAYFRNLDRRLGQVDTQMQTIRDVMVQGVTPETIAELRRQWTANPPGDAATQKECLDFLDRIEQAARSGKTPDPPDRSDLSDLSHPPNRPRS